MTATIHTCHICSGQFTGYKKKYCSDACVKASEVLRTTSALHRAKGKAKRDRMKAQDPDAVKAHRRAQYLKYRSLKPKCDCENCGKSKQGFKRSGFCKSCRKISNAIRLREKYRKNNFPELAPIFDGSRKADPRTCIGCNEIFAPRFSANLQQYCNSKCAKKHRRTLYGQRRRALKMSAKVCEAVDPFKVFDRDGWRCQICMVKTPRSKRGSLHDRAPELDHILPLSKGGDHSYANTQCACRKCNGLKGSKIYGQMPLFAT